jgi:hypothetical protein
LSALALARRSEQGRLQDKGGKTGPQDLVAE